MDKNNTAVLSPRLHLVKAWLISRIQPFYQWLSPVQRCCFVMALIPLPVYVIEGQIFDLLHAVGGIVSGAEVAWLPFIALLTETLLILYTCMLIVLYQKSSPVVAGKIKTEAYRQAHPCIMVCEVPLHLYHDEVKPDHSEDIDFTNSFVGLSADDQELVDSLPKAIEILKNNAAMLDFYEERQPAFTTTDEAEVEPLTESLLDMLNRERRPPIQSADDLQQLTKSTNQ